MNPLRIIIDTREQAPWHFPEELATTIRGKLDAGDYALAGDHFFAIERKSLDDFLGTISTGWERFQRELERMQIRQFPARIVLVEGDFTSTCFRQDEDDQLLPPRHNHPQLTPQFVASRIAGLALQGVSVLFAGGREQASGLALHIFRHRTRQLEEKTNG